MGKKTNRKKNARRKKAETPPVPDDAETELSAVSVEATENEVEVATEADVEAKDVGDEMNVEANGDGAAQQDKEDGITPENGKKQSKGRFAWLTSPMSSAFSTKRINPPLPPSLEGSIALFTPTQQELARRLCELPGTTNQRHLFENWSSDPEYDEKKRALMTKLEMVDQSYPDGGLIGYLSNAVNLLEKSRKGDNPLEGWEPSVPKGEAFVVGTDAFVETEKLGLMEVGKCGFVLVAGGLGERLGYGDIKVSW